ncbi:fluoride efflux transporter CrcB [Tropicimonas isoalkanivorans]|uniref:Fluoride-specific ion channel FluC n=1 Tax=Tropicimonas isoalkanivorans TaxID=441112 RepID=A0A1I1PSX7_9RHOB|nr:fluoride efflux transporter CrcB [Tropicimonas isoalkanivorans]SFD10718.1 camphor resistance protein CrcB [Tropicimonas isoalkanivorans]
MIFTVLQVALGGAIGASCRYLTNVAMKALFGIGFPWGTLTVNIVGSFLMGALVVVLERKGGNHLTPLLMTGLLGGFTTFSAFSLDTIFLMEEGRAEIALIYIAASVLISLAALVIGLAFARGVVPLP